MKKIITGILTGIATLIFISSIGIMFIGTRAIQRNEPLFIFGYSFSIVPTDSMIGDQEDSIDPYDIAIIKRISFDEIEIGDVIVFQGEIQGMPALIIHRVVGVHPEGGYETKGDNPLNSVDPDPVTEENFKAVYQSKITFLKPIAELALGSRSIIFGSLIIVLLVMVILEVMSLIKTVKKEQENKLREQMKETMKEQMYQEVLEEERMKLPPHK
ncbi:MAG: S26 family signal peptidase [Acholeplasma sp.]|nr:MAG: S26 family signal peptidase [Acholeplasma sp.]